MKELTLEDLWVMHPNTKYTYDARKSRSGTWLKDGGWSWNGTRCSIAEFLFCYYDDAFLSALLASTEKEGKELEYNWTGNVNCTSFTMLDVRIVTNQGIISWYCTKEEETYTIGYNSRQQELCKD